MKDIISANIVLVNILLIAFFAGTILHALHSKDTFEKKILNIIMIVILPGLGSLIYCMKAMIKKSQDGSHLG
jgi:uncharacterized membrane protein YczE